MELAKSRGLHVVVAGCVPQGAPRSAWLAGVSVAGVQQIDRIVELVEETLKGQAPYTEQLQRNSKIEVCIVPLGRGAKQTGQVKSTRNRRACVKRMRVEEAKEICQVCSKWNKIVCPALWERGVRREDGTIHKYICIYIRIYICIYVSDHRDTLL